MNHKRILLVAFLLMLFFLDRAEPGKGISLNQDNLFHVNSMPASGLPQQVNVTMLRLDANGAPKTDSKGNYEKCRTKPKDTAYGCVEVNNTGATYPYETNPVSVPVETDYLVNVLPHEMDVTIHNPPVAALKAQTLAARSIADWKYRANGFINNSIFNQVFVPRSFEFYTRSVPLVWRTDPCNKNGGYNTLNALQTQICDVVTSTTGQYLSHGGTGLSIDAEFGSDAGSLTVAEGTQPYLKSVHDPISTTCGAVWNYSGWGMSQKGAMRWALGSQCASQADQSMFNNGQTSPWPVIWSDYRQILAHYYTGIDILNANGNKIAPDNRWNLLSHNIPTSMNLGQTYTFDLYLQNTSTSDWAPGDVTLEYQWTLMWQEPQRDGWTTIGSLPSVSKGAPVQLSSISITAPSTPEVYTLHLDLKRANGDWFTYAGWPHPKFDFNMNAVSIPISDAIYDAGTNPTPCAFVAGDPEVYLGACFNKQAITSGFLFKSISVPRHALIQSAYIVFSVDGEFTNPTNVQILIENSVYPAPYTGSLVNRTLYPDNQNAILVPWNISTPWYLGNVDRTENIAPLIQKIVDLETWNPGVSSISIIIRNAPGTETVRRVIAWERAHTDPNLNPARLVITYLP